jgi:hypothetical protein
MTWRKPADRLLAHAIVQAFRGDADRSYVQLSSASRRAWEKSDFWLDASGLAFYFLHQVFALGIADALPHEVLQRLTANLRKNKIKTNSMFYEFRALNQCFRSASIIYSNHKGFTLCPHACPAPELRHQVDFDFIVAPKFMTLARECLELRGYTLSARSHKTWEFKAGNYARPNWDLYSMGTYRCVELHSSALCGNNDERLERVSQWNWDGHEFPALAPADQLIAQALHLFGHLRGEATRPAWVLEFRRHVLSHRDEVAFWTNVRQLASSRRHASMALGISVLIGSQMFGRFAPQEVEGWAISSVAPAIRLWVQRYGVDAVLADFPGTKLFLLLEQEIERIEGRPARAVRARLLPLHLGRVIFAPRRQETGTERRYRIFAQLRFMAFRLRFHISAAGRYLLERRAWDRALLRHELDREAEGQLAGREMTNRKQDHDNRRPDSLYAGGRSIKK